MQVLIKLGYPPRFTAGRRSHLRDQKSTVFQRQKVVGNAGLRRARREQELGMTCVRDIEEENAILSPKQTEQAATAEDLFICRKMTVVRLIAYVTGRWNGNSSNDFSIVLGLF